MNFARPLTSLHVAQLVEHLTTNQKVTGSNPVPARRLAGRKFCREATEMVTCRRPRRARCQPRRRARGSVDPKKVHLRLASRQSTLWGSLEEVTCHAWAQQPFSDLSPLQKMRPLRLVTCSPSWGIAGSSPVGRETGRGGIGRRADGEKPSYQTRLAAFTEAWRRG